MNSIFVSLTDYCIVEYMATPLGDPSPQLLTTTFYKLANEHTSSRQIYNTDGYRSVTKNSRDLSVVGVGGSRSIYLDTSISPIYTEYDNKLTQTQVSAEYSLNQVVDKVKLHFASGFNFTEVQNIIFGVKQALNDGSQLLLANLLLDSQTAQEIFSYSVRPLFLANTVYDRYVEIVIPSMPWMNDDFDEFGSASFEHQITDGIGFVRASPVKVFLAEAAYEEYNAPNNVTYDRYQLNDYFEAPISQSSKFDTLGCHIAEAENGDYIEYFATWNNAFPAALISILNESGTDQDWIFVHQLQVYEQVGGSLIPAGNQLIYQENDFDTPLYFRPILKNAGSAFAMSIDYTLRLLNKKTGEQIIKTGSLSVINPNKYGLRLEKLSLPEGPQSMKVYNKIIQKNFEVEKIFSPKSAQTPAAATQPTGPAPTIQRVEVPVPQYVLIKQQKVRLSQRNALSKVGNEDAEIIYGQGKLVIPIDPTDNLIKFTVYQANPLDRSKQDRVNLNNNSEFRLVFGKTNDFVFAQVNDATLTSPSQGELCFRVPKELAKQLVETTDPHFHLSIVSKMEGTETVLYTGTWTQSENYAQILAAEEDALTVAANEATIAELQKQIAELTSKNEDLAEQLEEAKSSGQNSSNVSNVNAAAAAGTQSSQMD